MDPSRNNMPLDFNKNKGKPPVVYTNTGEDGVSSSTATAAAIAAATAAASSTNTMMTNSQYNMAHMANETIDLTRNSGKMQSNMGGGNMQGNMGPGNMQGNMGGGNMQGNMGPGNMQGNMGPGNMQGSMVSPGNMGPGNMQGNMGPSNMQGNMGDGNMGNMANLASNLANMATNMMGPMGPLGPMGPNMMMGPMNMGQFGGMMGAMGPMGMMAPDGMNMGMGPMGPGPMGPPMQQKEVITLNSCVLLPPHPDAPSHSVRDRPPGCRTAFVGGLPENITEEILQEVFEKSGPIESIRLGKKNFAHVRFIRPESVEQAMYLSGYRMKIDNKDDKANTGRIHVDYANARNDQHEYECEQRAIARDMRHQQQVQEERLRVPSPPPATPFTVYDGNALLDVLKTDAGLMKAAQQLVTWLDKGNVDKRSANLFYSLIQSSNTHVRRLVTEKQQYEEELNQAKLLFKQRVQGVIVQLGQIESVFGACRKQRNWDHFTKAQRKNIDTWHKQVQDIRQSQQAQFLNERNEDEMDFSDTEVDEKEPSPKKRKANFDGVAASMEAAGQLVTLKEENDSLKCQLEAYVNEAAMVKMESKQHEEAMDKQMKSLQNALKGMQQQLISQQAQVRAMEGSKSPASDRTTSRNSTDKAHREEDKEDEEPEEQPMEPPPMPPLERSQDTSVTSSGIGLSEKEARMLGLIACFLNVHPSGATVDYLWSYLSQLITKVKPREIEDLLDRLPSLFRQDLAGVGATLERRWCFVGYTKEKA
ncbi:ecto-NOX disulfide-thiol exchanger 2-like [Littorina saxatilis]|uniref:RRM domain-containing protein n=1 Tax=Littorina saxatilis TaxID=31220 RepID=A0AAN9FZM5_9CAEN